MGCGRITTRKGTCYHRFLGLMVGMCSLFYEKVFMLHCQVHVSFDVVL